MTEPPCLDPTALARLREWGGEKLANQMVKLFLANSNKRMDQIRAGVAENELSEAEKGSHSLKSSAANVGASLLRELCSDIEEAAVEGNMDSVKAIMPELENAYERAISELRVVIPESEATE